MISLGVIILTLVITMIVEFTSKDDNTPNKHQSNY
ncbi:hypothetical protein JOC59_000928 [Weissella beninensis]|nr:hypothetical protein [Periweissella beninensis]